MSIAAFATPGILAPFQAFFHWLVTDAIPLVRPSSTQGSGHLHPSHHAKTAAAGLGRSNQVRIGNRCQPLQPAVRPMNARNAVASPSLRKPISKVRMVRVVEAGQAPASVGRMVISGRMADVCAELDRLASREAAQR